MKLVSLLLVSLLVCEGTGFADQAPPSTETSQVQTQETPQAAKIKAKVQKRGTGEKSRVKVKLANGTEVKGCVSKIEETSFTVTDKKTGQTTIVAYADVQKVQGPGLSKGGKIALVAIGVGVVVLVAIGVAVGHAD
jgi:sRNA-binding regulator protein Hfq